MVAPPSCPWTTFGSSSFRALSISADDLLGRKAAKARGSGPVGCAKKLFDSISRLPRHQQEKIISILEPFVREHVATNGKH